MIRAKVIHTWQNLSQHQRKQLRRLANRARDAGLRCRCKVILALVRGSTPTMIAQVGLCAKSQVYRVAGRFLTAGLAGLADRREDNGQDDLDLGLITPSRRVARFLTATGPDHKGSELTGVTFSPNGRRLFVSSQRYKGGGAIFEITGPFRTARPRA